MNKITSLSYELKELIEKDERFILYKEKEKKMESNEEVMALAYNKDLKETYLSDTLKHFPSSSPEAKKARLELFRASEKLDAHPLVKEYMEASKKVDELYKEINDILFASLKK